MRAFMLSAVGPRSLDPQLLQLWVDTVTRLAEGQHLNAGRYKMTAQDQQGLYALVVESDLMAQQVSEYLRQAPVRHATATRVGQTQPAYDDIFKQGSEIWRELYRRLQHLYLNGTP